MMRTTREVAGLPAGTLLKGRFQADETRIYIDVTSAVVAGKEIPVRGYAVTSGVPGVPAAVKTTDARKRHNSAVGRTALGTLRAAANSVSGGLAGTLVGGAADGVTREAEVDLEVPSERVLELSPGTVLEVVFSG